MAIDVILMEDVESLGKLGDQATVANGYARNYLLPKKFAIPVTPANLRRLKAKKLRLQQEYQSRVSVAQAMAEKMTKDSVTIPVQATDDEKLYGSVTATQIAEALAANGIEIDRHSVKMDEPIRQLGVYNVTIDLHEEVTASLKVWVVRE